MFFKRKDGGYDVLAYFDGNMKTIGYVKKYFPRATGPARWRAVDINENNHSFDTRAEASGWLIYKWGASKIDSKAP